MINAHIYETIEDAFESKSENYNYCVKQIEKENNYEDRVTQIKPIKSDIFINLNLENGCEVFGNRRKSLNINFKTFHQTNQSEKYQRNKNNTNCFLVKHCESTHVNFYTKTTSCLKIKFW